jgi:uncharacterized membrane protein
VAPGDEREELRERPIAELLKELSHETATLVHQEMELAKAELSQKGNKARAGAGAGAAAAVVGLASVGSLTACFILALAAAVPAWLSALIVAVVYAVIAAVLGQISKDKLQKAAPPVPEQTVESVKEDVQWAKTQARSARR